MPAIDCNCGKMTNTAVCDWIDSKNNKAEKCYIAYENDKWIKGCAYDETPLYMKKTIDSLLKGK